MGSPIDPSRHGTTLRRWDRCHTLNMTKSFLTSSAPAVVTVKGFVLQAHTVGRAVIGVNHFLGAVSGLPRDPVRW